MDIEFSEDVGLWPLVARWYKRSGVGEVPLLVELTDLLEFPFEDFRRVLIAKCVGIGVGSNFMVNRRIDDRLDEIRGIELRICVHVCSWICIEPGRIVGPWVFTLTLPMEQVADDIKSHFDRIVLTKRQESLEGPCLCAAVRTQGFESGADGVVVPPCEFDLYADRYSCPHSLTQ